MTNVKAPIKIYMYNAHSTLFIIPVNKNNYLELIAENAPNVLNGPSFNVHKAIITRSSLTSKMILLINNKIFHMKWAVCLFQKVAYQVHKYGQHKAEWKICRGHLNNNLEMIMSHQCTLAKLKIIIQWHKVKYAKSYHKNMLIKFLDLR